MPFVPGLRSPYALVGDLVYFGRMLDKIRLRARGELPADYLENVGEGRAPLFDARVCRFLNVRHHAFVERTLAGGCDEEILAWAESVGRNPGAEERHIWNQFMMKIGWRDDRSEVLAERLRQAGLEHRVLPTAFDLLEADEGREPERTEPWKALRKPDTLVVMGVSGSGKSTLARALASHLGWRFLEGDDFHSEENRRKMASGTPLTDSDRQPWLLALAEALSSPGPKVLSCSALREAYRRLLAPDPARIRFVMTHAPRAVLEQRLAGRAGHFMPASLLQSQLDTLETPAYALQVDAREPLPQAAEKVVSILRLR